MSLNVSVFGAGSWGTTVAALASRNAPTMLWARRPEAADEINDAHTNARYLPGARLPRGLRSTASMRDALRDADVFILAVPSHVFRSALKEAREYVPEGIPIVSLTKGLEEGRQLRMTEIVEELLPGHPAGVLTGPNLAREIMSGYAAASVIALRESRIAAQLQDLLSSGLFRVYTNRDVIGCELGGALKNVIAIAAGMGDGVGVGENTKAAVITRGLAELTRLGVAMGGEPQTFSGLAGMGDLIATCTSRDSRNRYVGEQLGRGRKLDQIVAEMHMVAEGIKTCRVVIELADKYGVEMPIAREVFGCVYAGATARQAYRGLTRLAAGSEQEPG